MLIKPKKYKFGITRKTTIYLVIMIVAVLLSQFIQIINGYDIWNKLRTIIVWISGAFAAFYFLRASYYFEEGYFTHNSLFGETVKLDKIKAIRTSQNNIYIDYEELDSPKSLKLRSYLLENNPENAREMTEKIIKGASEKAQIDEKVIAFSNGECNGIAEGDYAKFGGLLIVLASITGVLAIYDLLEIFSVIYILSIKNDVLFILYIALKSISLIIAVLAFVYLVSKEKRAIKTIKFYLAYRIFTVVSYTVLIVSNRLNEKGNLSFLFVVDGIVDIVYVIFIALVVIEFMKTSKRVKYSLVK